MRIGLIDVDGHNFPNLPLMKISAFYKENGCDVDFYNPLIGHTNEYDIVFVSKVFTFTPDYQYPIYSKEIFIGGTGYSLNSVLPEDIENSYPDYSLYNIKNTAYGFLSRGCPRNCNFCIVTKKEGGLSYKAADLNKFWHTHKEIKLLDPNLLACKDKIELLNQLAESKAYIDFTQGLDIRLINEEISLLIMKCKIKTIHFAWDKEQDSGEICKKLREFKSTTKIEMRKARVYVLVNFDTSFEFDLYRIYELKNMGYDPYVMIYNKEKSDIKYRKLQRWVNNKFIFRSCDKFEDYKR